MQTHTFLSYLTDEQIARQLCKEASKWKRVTYMTLRHVKHHEPHNYVRRIEAFAAELRDKASNAQF